MLAHGSSAHSPEGQLTVVTTGWSSETGDEMNHREFLNWLRPQLDSATATGLSREAVVAIREQLEQ